MQSTRGLKFGQTEKFKSIFLDLPRYAILREYSILGYNPITVSVHFQFEIWNLNFLKNWLRRILQSNQRFKLLLTASTLKFIKVIKVIKVLNIDKLCSSACFFLHTIMVKMFRTHFPSALAVLKFVCLSVTFTYQH